MLNLVLSTYPMKQPIQSPHAKYTCPSGQTPGWGVILTDVWDVKWKRTRPTMLSIAKATRSNKCSSSDWGGLKLRAIWNRTWATRRNRKSSVQMQHRPSRKHCNSFKHQSQAASGTSICFVDYRKRNVVLKHQHFICCCFQNKTGRVQWSWVASECTWADSKNSSQM